MTLLQGHMPAQHQLQCPPVSRRSTLRTDCGPSLAQVRVLCSPGPARVIELDLGPGPALGACCSHVEEGARRTLHGPFASPSCAPGLVWDDQGGGLGKAAHQDTCRVNADALLNQAVDARGDHFGPGSGVSAGAGAAGSAIVGEVGMCHCGRAGSAARKDANLVEKTSEMSAASATVRVVLDGVEATRGVCGNDGWARTSKAPMPS